MTIYQEEMMRKLPKLGCTGTLDEAKGMLAIRQNGVFLCQQLADGTLLYTDDEVTSQNFRDNHPHIHLISYSVGKEPYMTERGLMKMKANYAHEIFKQVKRFTAEKKKYMHPQFLKDCWRTKEF